jgi:hypothetical protein
VSDADRVRSIADREAAALVSEARKAISFVG